jgi:hypothetical protein
MIEIYVLLTLSGLGYLMNKMSSDSQKKITLSSPNLINVNEIPSMNTVYESKYLQKADQKVRDKAEKKFTASMDPKTTRVIADNTYPTMSLTGERYDPSEFKHNNMVPFYGGQVRQNMDDKANRNILENFTGVDSGLIKKKTEVKSFYDSARGNVNGMQNRDEFFRERMVAPTQRNNEFPIEQTRVGPGLGLGYTDKPTGGFQQFDTQNFLKQRTVDDLRTKLNPNKNALGQSDIKKETYDARLLDGKKSILRGDPGLVSKNLPETFYEQSPDMLLRTTGANLKPAQQGKFNVKETNRLTTTRQNLGTAFAAQNLARTADPAVKKTARKQFEGNEFGPAALGAFGVGQKDDYGKSKILVYSNERDVTSTRVYQGNLTSFVKAIIAPIEDMVKITKKQHTVDNPRHYGNIKGNEKMTIYDPNDVARTTIKETLIHDEIGTGTLTGAKAHYVYDPDEVARKTVRETLERMDYEMNMSANVHKGKVYDPDDLARKTIKETVVDLEREYGNIDARARGGGYETNEMDAKDTQKQFISDNDYFGVGTRDKGEGYITNEMDAKDTQKQFLSDYEYFGIAEAGADKKQMSYEDIYNAHINANKEVTLSGREPTQSGQKVFNDCVNVAAPRKLECDLRNERESINRDRIYNAVPAVEDAAGMTRFRKMYDPTREQQLSLDVSVLDALKTNPFAQSLHSVA